MGCESERDALKAAYNHPYPELFMKRGLKPIDIVEFGEMYQLSPEDAQEQILYFDVHGRSIERIIHQNKTNGITKSRREAAHEYYDSRFLNRTVDRRGACEPNT